MGVRTVTWTAKDMSFVYHLILHFTACVLYSATSGIIATEGSFFGNSWIGKEVEFTNPGASKWRTKEKTSERAEQFDSLDLQTLNGPTLSYSWAISNAHFRVLR